MHNPFRFGNPVEGEYYLDRPQLRNTVQSFLNNGTNVVLIGPRRFGKTSFILDLLAHQENQHKRTSILVDIFNITSHRDFLQQLLNALRDKRSLLSKLKDWIRGLPSQYNPVINVDTGGNMSLQFSPQYATDDQIKQLIMETFDSLARLSPNLCIAFDEFQSIARIEDGGWLEATIRTKMQEHKEVSFLYSGSRRSIIHDMFNNSARPFYRTCQLIDFPPFGPEFTPWIVGRFAKAQIRCDAALVEYMRDQVSNTPNYVQMLCFHIVASGYTEISKPLIDDSLHTIVKQNAYAYQTLLNSLSPIQQRVLKLAACAKESVFSKENLEKYEIKSAGNVQSAIIALKHKQLLDESTQKGRVVFDDPLFALWLQYQFPDLANPQQPALPLL